MEPRPITHLHSNWTKKVGLFSHRSAAALAHCSYELG